MRPAQILAYAVFAALAGCASSEPSASDWQRDQLARLEREHRHLPLADVLAEVIAEAPAPRSEPPAAQGPEPDKIDQRLPQRPGHGRRSFRHSWQPLVATVDVGVGDVMVRADGTRLNDRTDAVFARARVETGEGAALHAEYWASDPDLFRGDRINDGIVPRIADAELSGFDVFPHLRLDCDLGGDWRMPVRLGAFVDWQQLDHQPARVEREWLGFGPRVALEPTWHLLDGEQGSLQLFTRFAGDLGAAWFSEEFVNGDDRDVAARWSGEVGGGLRGSYGAMHAEIGYRLQHVMVGDLQGDLFGSSSGTELQRQQVFVGFGITY
ncbi:MAG: hypothetical protein KAI24_24870 [Planctomycetes bacterium]|nr:hypothetical protein [Planctomycetota bacterium]